MRVGKKKQDHHRFGFWSWKQDLAMNLLCSLVATPQRNGEGVSDLLLSQLLSLCLALLI